MKFLNTFFAAIILLSFAACTKTTDVKPVSINNSTVDDLSANPSGDVERKRLRGFRAKVNGSRWAANGLQADSTPIEGPAYYATFGSDTTSLLIFAKGSYEGYEDASFAQILLWVYNFNGPGSYTMGVDGATGIAVFTVAYTDGRFNQFYTGTDAPGIINITEYDRNNKMISGNFDFRAKSLDSAVIVRNGLFQSVPLQ
ncbi:MAG TPA: DUF6252 family protein [Panacibacter sp.]|nr:DUF6252 family protein [Panacibacter sp.]